MGSLPPLVVFWPRFISLPSPSHLSALSACYLHPGLKLEVKSPEKDVSSELFTGIFAAQWGCRSNKAICPFTVETIKLTCEGVRNLMESDRTTFSVISPARHLRYRFSSSGLPNRSLPSLMK